MVVFPDSGDLTGGSPLPLPPPSDATRAEAIDERAGRPRYRSLPHRNDGGHIVLIAAPGAGGIYIVCCQSFMTTSARPASCLVSTVHADGCARWARSAHARWV